MKMWNVEFWTVFIYLFFGYLWTWKEIVFYYYEKLWECSLTVLKQVSNTWKYLSHFILGGLNY